jgi:glycine/D-amino acid oxidase-like deaminating enzyme
MLDNLSYWEHKLLSEPRDLIIIGAGIVGLMTALHYKQKHPKHSVLILERGALPDGASTKNAGFACFGSAGEILSDLKTQTPESVWETVKMRYEGLGLLRQLLGDTAIKYQALGGYEVFENQESYESVNEQLVTLNKQMFQTIGNSCYVANCENKYGLAKHVKLIKNNLEGQIDTGLMMRVLLEKIQNLGVEIQYGAQVKGVVSQVHTAVVESSFCTHTGSNVVVATNGFASTLLPTINVLPARAQVVVTKPIVNLAIKGSFHFNEGYYYFRNIDGRVLFGGGRNLDKATESTFENGYTDLVQDSLEKYLRKLILPNQSFEIERRWSGIMGLGPEKKPIIQYCSNRVLAVVRMGGMGLAIGSKVGQKAASMLD